MVLAQCACIELSRSIRTRTPGSAHIANAADPHQLRSDVWTIRPASPLAAGSAEHSEAVNFLVAEVVRLQCSPRKLNSHEFSYQLLHSLSATRLVPMARWSRCASARKLSSESRGHERRCVCSARTCCTSRAARDCCMVSAGCNGCSEVSGRSD